MPSECRFAWLLQIHLQRSLAERNRVPLMWTSGDKGIKGNEDGDILAKKGLNICFPCLKPFCGLKNTFERGIPAMKSEKID